MARRHVVQDGDCLSSLSARYGFRDWRTIYDHADNAALRARRPNPNLLAPGDVVMIPDREQKDESGVTAARHTFVTPAPACTVELRFVDARGGALAKSLLTLSIDGATQQLRTDGDGRVRAPIPRDAKSGEATIGTFTWPLAFGTLRPAIAEDWPAIQERLTNLGYPCERAEARDEATAAALRAFQHDRHLPESGELDDGTRAALLAAHGC